MCSRPSPGCPSLVVFFFNDTATTEIYTLSRHDALPISVLRCLESLEHDGWLQINKKAVEYRGNSYQIVLEKLSFERPKSGVRLKPEKKSQVSINKSQVSTRSEERRVGKEC